MNAAAAECQDEAAQLDQLEMQLRQHRRRREEIQIRMPRLEEEIARAQASILSIEKAQSGLESKLAALNHQIQRQKASLEFSARQEAEAALTSCQQRKEAGERALHRLQADYEACRQTREAADTRIKALQEQLEEAQYDVLPDLLAQAGEHQKTLQENAEATGSSVDAAGEKSACLESVARGCTAAWGSPGEMDLDPRPFQHRQWHSAGKRQNHAGDLCSNDLV